MNSRLLDHPATKRVAIASVAVVLFAGIVAVATHKDGGVGDARLRTKGRANLTLANGSRQTVTGTVALHRGDVVEAVDDTITLELPDGSTVEGRPGFKRNDATRIRVAAPVELLAGELLVVASRGTDVDAGGNRVHVDRSTDGQSAVRVSRGLAVDAGVYRGSASLDSAGQKRTLPALRAIEVSALGRPPADVSPITVDDQDTWDRRFLGEAMDLGHTLDSYSVGYSNTLGARSADAAFYRAVVPSVANESALTAQLIASSGDSPGETLVAIAIAGLGRRGDFASRFHAVFDFRHQHANWGLVALDQGVERDPLLSDMQQALNASSLQFAEAARTPPTSTTAPPITAGTSAPPAATGGTTGTGTGGGGSGGGGSGGGGTTTTTPLPSPLPPPPSTGSPLVDGIVQDVNNLTSTTIGGLSLPG